MIAKFFRSVHKVLGLLLSLLFLLWFVSGIVMIWHSFPKASQDYRIFRQEPLCASLPSAEDISNYLPDSVMMSSLQIQMRFDRPMAEISGKGLKAQIYLDSLVEVEPFDESVRAKTLALWCDAPVKEIDTLSKVDQWIPFERWTKQMPIYKYYFDDEQKHQLYMTQDGNVIQFTDKVNRFWAWVGAIPHWVYFTLLRQHQTLWTKFVIWAGYIGCVMCICGFVIALIVWFKHKKKTGVLAVPYKKRWHRWHFISGFVFGLFAISFAFSGVMSMTDLPGWLKKKRPQEEKSQMMPRRGMQRGKMLSLDKYLVDYREVIDASDSVKAISFESWKNNPYYKVTYSKSVEYIDAASVEEVKPFALTKEMVAEDVQQKLPKDAKWEIELIDEFDSDYFARKKERAPLPVYRVIADDAMNTRLYYNPKTLQVKQVNDDTRRRSFAYGGLHKLEIKFLTDRPVLWHIVMFTLLIGGSFLSLTGVVLSVKLILRKIKRLTNN